MTGRSELRRLLRELDRRVDTVPRFAWWGLLAGLEPPPEWELPPEIAAALAELPAEVPDAIEEAICRAGCRTG